MAQMTVAPYEAPTTHAGVIREQVKVEAALRGLTQTKVGEMVRLSQPAVADRYTGRTEWRLNEIELLEQALGLSRGALLVRCAIRDSNPKPADLCPTHDDGLNTISFLAGTTNVQVIDGWELAA